MREWKQEVEQDSNLSIPRDSEKVGVDDETHRNHGAHHHNEMIPEFGLGDVTEHKTKA
eukprot:CAMPEP_0201479280 /NCGR_PEP_ID=MMETSP0151_2-20130828/3984_1 /ASSEMBLY_ACC=CAM_ASM_000257 /TAXON_ID=200890 /ORGANISM="Paramoeba atlantica, Strain 621/1 / CCAP 1560/9" /LENGTH=57 /DNA_ID=CAMNT_0047860689 /DNA_START=197 /DNA_END=373 /DNA_ORIENTATION=+